MILLLFALLPLGLLIAPAVFNAVGESKWRRKLQEADAQLTFSQWQVLDKCQSVEEFHLQCAIMGFDKKAIDLILATYVWRNLQMTNKGRRTFYGDAVL